jgi:hypothetical protein
VFTLTDNDDKEPVVKESSLTNDGNDRKEVMVEEFAAQSGKNMQWARMCLVEFYWDYQQAIYKFNKRSAIRSI